MTILYLANCTFPHERANGIQTMETCAALAARGHAVHLLVRPDAATPAREPFRFYGVPPAPQMQIHNVRVFRPRSTVYRARALLRLLLRRRWDVVFTRELAMADAALRCPARWRPPLVFESHGFNPVRDEFRGRMPGGRALAPRVLRRLVDRERRVWRRADGYVAITRTLVDELVERFGPRAHVATAPSGVRLGPSRRFERVKHAGRPTVVYAGHLYEYNGVDVLIEALTRLPHARLRVVGGHPRDRADRARLAALVRDRGLTERVAFTGPAAPLEVPDRLRDAHALVAPLLDVPYTRYASPLKLFQYMAAGRPIVASDLPCHREVLRDGATARLFTPGDPEALSAALQAGTGGTGGRRSHGARSVRRRGGVFVGSTSRAPRTVAGGGRAGPPRRGCSREKCADPRRRGRPSLMSREPHPPVPEPSPWPWIATRVGWSAALLAAWLLVALGWAPALIRAGYSEASIGLVNAIFASRAEHPVEEYLAYWRRVVWVGVVWCVGIWFVGPLRRRVSSRRFFERAVGAATPGALGAVRAWTCGTLLVMTLWEDLASSVLLPREMMRPRGVMFLLHLLPIGFDEFLANATALWLFEHFTALLLFLGVIGLGTRFVVPASAVCYLIMAGILRGYAWFYHTGLIPIYVLAVLAFTPCDQGWSVDRLRRIARGDPVPAADRPAAVFGWARYAVWTVLSVPYVAAGCSKLYYGGLEWVAPDNMRSILLHTGLAMMEFDFDVAAALVQAPSAVFLFLSVTGLGTELLFGLVLVSRRARFWLPAAMALVHIGILFLQNILFLDLILLQAVFYDWRPARLTVERWWAAYRVPARTAPGDGTPTLPERAAPVERMHRRGALASLAIAGFLASWWITHIEFYPFTTMKMFAAPYASMETIEYVWAVAHYEDGTSGRAPFERWIGATADSRYRRVIAGAFGGAESRALCRKFLDASLRAAFLYGEAPRPVSIEIQLWRWNVVDDPGNPDHGVLVDRYVHDAGGPGGHRTIRRP